MIGDRVYLVGLLMTPVLVKNIPLKSTTRYENYEKVPHLAQKSNLTPRKNFNLDKNLNRSLDYFQEYFLNIIIVFCTCKFRLD